MNELYEDLLPIIAKMHAVQRGFWKSRWVEEDASPEEAEGVLIDIVIATMALERTRDGLNEITGCGEPDELEQDDGESHLRGMEAFASGGMDAYNEARGYGSIAPMHSDDDY